MDESEANELNDIINKSFKEVFFILIAQPIEKERVINQIPQRKNRFDILEKTMKTHHLTLNMRNSIEIHELAEVTKEVLKEEMTFFVHPEKSETNDESEASKESEIRIWKDSIPNEFLPTQDDHLEAELNPKLEIEGQSLEISSNAKMGLDETKDDSEEGEKSKESMWETSILNEFLSTKDDHQEVELNPNLEIEGQSVKTSSDANMGLDETNFESEASKDNESISENSVLNEFESGLHDHQEKELNPKLKIEWQSVETSSEVKMGLDEAQAILGSPMVKKGQGGGKRTVSNFVFAQVEKTGHQINTERPVLFELGGEEDFDKNLSLIAIFERLLEFRRKHVVLHFDTEINAIPSNFRFVFDHHFKKQKITTNYKKFESSKKCILVCSYPSFRGLEYPRITVLIDRDIYFVKHYLVETLARCTSELCIVVLKNSSTLTKVITEWKMKKLVIQWKTDILKKDILRKDYQIEIDAKHNTINTTFKTQYYKTLEEGFKLSGNNNETISSVTEHTAKKMIGQR